MSLGKNIFELRKKSGLSQEQLGKKINVSRQTISNWELEETSPNSEQLKLISNELNISIDELLDNNIELKKDFRKAINTQKKSNQLQIVFLIIGSPIWISLLITLVSVFISIYIVLWSIVICIWAAFVSTLVYSLVSVLVGIILAFINNKFIGLIVIGSGFICIGLSILLFFVSKLATKGILLLTNKIVLLIKNYFSKREVSR